MGLEVVFVGFEIENVLTVHATEIPTLMTLGLGLRLCTADAHDRQLASATQHRCCFHGGGMTAGDLMGQTLQMRSVQDVESAWVLVAQPIEFIRVGRPHMQRQTRAVATQTQPGLMAHMGLLFASLFP